MCVAGRCSSRHRTTKASNDSDSMVFQTIVDVVVYVTVVVFAVTVATSVIVVIVLDVLVVFAVVVIASSIVVAVIHVVLTTAGAIPGGAATTAATPTMLTHVGRIPLVDSELAAEGRPRRGRPSATGSGFYQTPTSSRRSAKGHVKQRRCEGQCSSKFHSTCCDDSL